MAEQHADAPIEGHAEEVTDQPAGALVPAPAPEGGTLILHGTSDPAAVMAEATGLAKVLADAIKQNHLSTSIQGREHVNVEGWQTLGAMTGVVAVADDAEPMKDRHGKPGWKACATAYRNGTIVGGAVGICSTSEKTWAKRDDYAIAAMAQTRAISRALRGPLGWIVHLAGYAAAGAEEMTAEQAAGAMAASEQDARDALGAARTLSALACKGDTGPADRAIEWLAGQHGGKLPQASALALMTVERSIARWLRDAADTPADTPNDKADTPDTPEPAKAAKPAKAATAKRGQQAPEPPPEPDTNPATAGDTDDVPF